MSKINWDQWECNESRKPKGSEETDIVAVAKTVRSGMIIYTHDSLLKVYANGMVHYYTPVKNKKK